jgi:phosphatidylinositol-4-phosphate 3-kinase
MLYAMSDGGTSNDAKHRFIDLCCNAYYTLRQNSSLLLLLLSHLCSSGVPNLNHDAVRFVYDRLAPSLNYADSITYFTKLIVDSLDSTWTQLNGFIHKLAQTTSLNSSSDTNSTLPSILNTYTILTDGKVKSAEVISYEKRTQPSKHYLYKLKVERLNITYHYRTYNEFHRFSKCLNKQFPLIGLDLKYSGQTEDKIIAQKRASDISDFLGNLFRLTDEVIEVTKRNLKNI